MIVLDNPQTTEARNGRSDFRYTATLTAYLRYTYIVQSYLQRLKTQRYFYSTVNGLEGD